MRSQRYLALAETLENKIKSEKDFVLPSIAALAVTYQVAYQTMWKAIQVLTKKGVLRTRHGIKIQRLTDTPPESLSIQLYKRLRNTIETGGYQAGTTLPKLDNLAGANEMSKITVVLALKMLASSKLIHQRKRQWIVGAATAERPNSFQFRKSAEYKVVVYLYDNLVSWEKSIGESFGGVFRTPFTSELLAYGIIVSPCLRVSGTAKGVPVPAGKEQTLAYIRSLGSRYAGTLTESVFPQEDGLEEWIATLLRFDKPVIYFDHAARGECFTRTFFSDKKRYYRLFQDEEQGVAMALNHLAQLGHSNIAVHGADIDEIWAHRRYATIQEQAQRVHLPMHIMGTQDLSPWRKEDLLRGSSFIRQLALDAAIEDPFEETTTQARNNFRQLILHASERFVSLLCNTSSTALLGLNDYLTREYSIWLRSLKIAIPRNLSLLSFDNNSDATFFQLSSIDWGFSRLGYCAAHIIIDDIPIKADRQGRVAGICTLADRGSIGAPAQKEERIEKVLKR